MMNLAYSAKTWSRLFYRTCQGLGDAILPRRCMACHTALPSHEKSGLAYFACGKCLEFISRQPRVRCKRCGLALGQRPQAFGWTHCWHCRPLFADEHCKPLNCIVCCDYIAPFDQWIASLKYGNNPGLARLMAYWLAISLSENNFENPDVLVPVPSGRNKLKQRGYNQAALIAGHLGGYIGRPVEKQLLVKTRDANAQAELDRAGRLQNLQGAFQATHLVPAGLHIGLVDDVITTGATTQSCVDALYKAGAGRISIIAVCRTPE